jgi:hypothetical protein
MGFWFFLNLFLAALFLAPLPASAFSSVPLPYPSASCERGLTKIARSLSGRFSAKIIGIGELELSETVRGESRVCGIFQAPGGEIDSLEFLVRGNRTRLVIKRTSGLWQVVDLYDAHENKVLNPLLFESNPVVIENNEDLSFISIANGEELGTLRKERSRSPLENDLPYDVEVWRETNDRLIYRSKTGFIFEVREHSGRLLSRYYTWDPLDENRALSKITLSKDHKFALIGYTKPPHRMIVDLKTGRQTLEHLGYRIEWED